MAEPAGRNFEPPHAAGHGATSVADTAGAWRDAALVAALVALSCVPYVAGLGHYADDWALLANLGADAPASALETLRTLLSERVLAPRPGYALYLWAVYELFGTAPLPAHLVNSAALVGAAALCLLALRELKLPAAGAFAIAATFGLLPHYATDRMWLATCHATLSMTLYFLSLYGELRLVHGGRGGWKVVSLAALTGSLLLYEVALPLFLANCLLVAVLGRQEPPPAQRRSPAARPAAQLANVALIVGIAVFKAGFKDRMRHDGTWLGNLVERLATLFDPSYQWQTSYGLNLFAALDVNYGLLGVLLPRSAWRITAATLDPVAMAVAAAIGLAIWLRLARAGPAWDRATSGKVVVAGFVVFALGYAIFITNDNMNFSPSGIANRVAIAGALSVAISCVGTWSLVARLAGPRRQAAVFAAGIALTCALCSAIVGGIGSYWKDAYRRELAVLDRFDRDVARVQPGATIILAGVCPFAGPAPVFESSWDFAGAVGFRHRLRSVQGNVLSGRMTPEPDGLHTTHYEAPYVHPYGPDLAVYDASTRRLTGLANHAEAVRYFADPGRLPDCPASFDGHGVPVL